MNQLAKFIKEMSNLLSLLLTSSSFVRFLNKLHSLQTDCVFRPLVTLYRTLNLFTIQNPPGICSTSTTELMWMDVWLIIADVNIAFL